MEIVQYICGEPDTTNRNWIDLDEFRFELEPGEFTLVWASCQIRTKALEVAEKTFPNYTHPEPFNLGNGTKIIEIGSALDTLSRPLLINCKAKGEEPELIKFLQKGERAGYTWRMSKETGLQAIASLGWLCSLSKARQPPITTSETDVVYNTDLFPTNTKIKEQAAPVGYNKKQIKLMEDARKLMSVVLEPIPELQEKWVNCQIVRFGELLFRTTSRVFESLPDLEAEEKEKFETMKAKAQASGQQQQSSGD